MVLHGCARQVAEVEGEEENMPNLNVTLPGRERHKHSQARLGK